MNNRKPFIRNKLPQGAYAKTIQEVIAPYANKRQEDISIKTKHDIAWLKQESGYAIYRGHCLKCHQWFGADTMHEMKEQVKGECK